jgi:repressor of nif and glnA expression
MQIERKYIVDELNHRVAVQLDIDTFMKIEETLENYGLTQIMEMLEPDDEILGLDQAKAYYRSLEKTQ